MIICRTNYCSNKDKILRLLVHSRKPFDAGANFRDVKLLEGKIIHPCTFSLAPSIPPFLPLSLPPPLPLGLKLKPAPKLLPACLSKCCVLREGISGSSDPVWGGGKCDRRSGLAQQTNTSPRLHPHPFLYPFIQPSIPPVPTKLVTRRLKQQRQIV